MSQAGIISVAGAGGTTNYVEDIGSATPLAGVLNIVGGPGVSTTGAGNTVTINVSDTGLTGSVTTVGAVSANLIVVPLGAVSSTWVFNARVAGVAIAGLGLPLGAAYTLTGGVRTDGVTAVLLPNQALDEFEDVGLFGAHVQLTVAGGSAVLGVSGAAGYTIDWTGEMGYTETT